MRIECPAQRPNKLGHILGDLIPLFQPLFDFSHNGRSDDNRVGKSGDLANLFGGADPKTNADRLLDESAGLF